MTAKYKILLCCLFFAITLFILLQRNVDKINSDVLRISIVHKYSYKDSYNLNLIDNYKIIPRCNSNLITWIVTSNAENILPRSALRSAYPNEELNELGIQRIFLLGLLNKINKPIINISQSALLDEANRFHDILQGNFIESYKNLTLKHLMGLQWVVNNCINAQFIMKMDDDIVANLYEMPQLLKDNLINNNTISGYILRSMKPIRNTSSKWFVNKVDYPFDVYPDFASGWLYITTLPVARKIVDSVSLNQQYFWIDDVFITGILREELGIKLNSINHLYATDYRYLNCCLHGQQKHLKCDYMIGPNGGDNKLQLKFKNFAKFCHRQCVDRTKQFSVNKTCITVYETQKLQNGHAKIQSLKIF
ncbi:beta-1,3-galactosyltransferase 5 [Prorops nasuta]|uniref:beta-1,3-galactosyltransferase 5 n=1 Tax=Prorops nasuta TaxID=863751 RepID=UPI0034CEE022